MCEGEHKDQWNNLTKVAIKKVYPTFEKPDMVADVNRAIDIMKTLNHPNLIKYISFHYDPTLLIMEFIEHSSLNVYLNNSGGSTEIQKLLKFSKDIAEGMKYLGEMTIVHHNLAARNILVDSNHCVKISDFGVAQFVGPSSYSIIKTTLPALPINWYIFIFLHKHLAKNIYFNQVCTRILK